MTSGKLVDLASALRLRNHRNTYALVARLDALGMAETCGRCGGSGRYSFNCVDGDRCYGCAGWRVSAPRRITDSFIAEVTAKVAAGGLDAYLARIRRIADAKKAIEPLDVWIAGKTAVGTRYNKKWMGSTGTHLNAINGAMCALSDRLRKIQDELSGNEPIPLDRQEALIAEARECGAKILALDYTDETLDDAPAARDEVTATK